MAIWNGLKSLITQRRISSSQIDLARDLQFPLDIAARKCDVAIVEYLLGEGAIITDQVASSTTCPFSGKQADALPVFQSFKEHGWDVNAEGYPRKEKGVPIFL